MHFEAPAAGVYVLYVLGRAVVFDANADGKPDPQARARPAPRPEARPHSAPPPAPAAAPADGTARRVLWSPAFK